MEKSIPNFCFFCLNADINSSDQKQCEIKCNPVESKHGHNLHTSYDQNELRRLNTNYIFCFVWFFF